MRVRLLLMVILASVPVFSQRGGSGGGRGGGEGMSGMLVPGVTRLDIITQVMQLNKDQKKFVKTVFDEAQKEAAPLREQISKSHLGIGAAVQAGKGQEEVNGLITSHTALEIQMTEIELKTFARVYLQLDPTQQGHASALLPMMKGMFAEKNWNNVQ
jgi:hypothetical protein